MSIFHVAVTGNNTNSGASDAPWRTPQKAVTVAKPGDTIMLHTGTYAGILNIDKPGSATLPITMKSAGDGPVTITATHTAEATSSAAPTMDRTLVIKNMAGYWNISDMNIVGGIWVTGAGIGLLPDTMLKTDHSAPGCGLVNDPAGARTIDAWFRGKGYNVTAIRGVKLERLNVTRRGVYGSLAIDCFLTDCTINNIDAYTGGGVWLGRASNFWTVSGNKVYDLKSSGTSHWMSECIRLATMTSNCLVEDNLVYDAAVLGRGVNCDANSNWCVYRNNTARRCQRNFANQKHCWANTWENNLGEDSREFNMSVGEYTQKITVRCNQSLRATKRDIFVTNSENGVFEKNYFKKVGISSTLQPKWGEWGNTWDGRTTVPVATDTMDVSAFDSCTNPVGSSL